MTESMTALVNDAVIRCNNNNNKNGCSCRGVEDRKGAEKTAESLARFYCPVNHTGSPQDSQTQLISRPRASEAERRRTGGCVKLKCDIICTVPMPELAVLTKE